MAITPGTHEYLEKLETLSSTRQLDTQTADFHKKISRLHFDTFTNIRRQRSCARNSKKPDCSSSRAPVQPGDISAFADDIQQHCRRLLQLLQDSPTARQPAITALSEAVASGALSSVELVANVYRQDEPVLIAQADSLGIPVDALLFVALACARPVLEALAAEQGSQDVQSSAEPACPVCGSIAHMARLMRADGQRRLYCQLCGTEWIFNRLRCAFCGNEKHDRLDVLMVDGTAYRIDACKDCLCYIKTVDERQINDEGYTFCAGIEDLATLYIDLIAEKHDYTKPVFSPTLGNRKL